MIKYKHNNLRHRQKQLGNIILTYIILWWQVYKNQFCRKKMYLCFKENLIALLRFCKVYMDKISIPGFDLSFEFI